MTRPHVVTASVRFPGLYRPGLIEASLSPGRQEVGKGRFRGFTAPASLKLAGVPRASRERERFPGLYRPGLIEAPAPAPTPDRASRVSGALPPRPH